MCACVRVVANTRVDDCVSVYMCAMCAMCGSVSVRACTYVCVCAMLLLRVVLSSHVQHCYTKNENHTLKLRLGTVTWAS